jgi:PhoH-like ATPase
MRVIADALGLTSEDYATNSVIEDKDKVYEGFAEVLVDDEFIEQFYQGKDMCLDESMLKERLYPNQFLLLISSSNPKKSAICRFHELKRPLQQINVKDYSRSWGIKPRNKEQTFAYDLLFDPEVPFMAIAAGLEQCLGIEERRYKKLVVSRPVQPMGKDIGFLPGSMEDKMMPWLMPLQDNLEHILGDKSMFKSFIEKGKIEVEALTYIRGRSISNAFIIIDEAQNLTAHEVKTIITRVGENTTNETSNGLTYTIEKFKSHDVAGHITFRKGERSKIATLASKIL